MRHSNTSARSADFASTEHQYPYKWTLSDLEKKEKNGLKVFSCFSCGGGSSMGYKLAGFDVIGCCEIDPAMMKVYKQNNHPRFSYLMDIRDFLKLEDLPPELYDLDILDGSPPCSVFSMAGNREQDWDRSKAFREGQSLQKLDDLFFWFIDVAERLQPKIVVAENVKGLMLGQAKGYVNEIFRKFSGTGYEPQMFLLNSAKMGVPQRRERVIFVARRKDLNLPKLRLNFNEKMIPFGDIRDEVGDDFREDGEIKKLIKYRIPSDKYIADIHARITRKNSGFTQPLNHDEEPSATITSGGTMLRYCDGLKMTKNDIIHCQTFPEDYDFLNQSVQYICGMSVPPVMMAHVAAEIYEQLLRS